MILLDTSALIWLAQRHRRARPLEDAARLFISPATILELQFLQELGRLRFSKGSTVDAIAEDPRWELDDPPSARWFGIASELAWTHDPFDRLLVAHARLRRWRLATSDSRVQNHVRAADILML